ncbi:MAG: hypothetical protein U0271_24725 [Polyangiaceae bacterium]
MSELNPSRVVDHASTAKPVSVLLSTRFVVELTALLSRLVPSTALTITHAPNPRMAAELTHNGDFDWIFVDADPRSGAELNQGLRGKRVVFIAEPDVPVSHRHGDPIRVLTTPVTFEAVRDLLAERATVRPPPSWREAPTWRRRG